MKHLLVILVLVMSACGGAAQQSQPPTPTVEAVELTETSVQFSWIHTIEFTGFYEAVRQGFYAANGLNVRLDGGGFDANGAYIDPVTRVVNGEVDFGVAGADVLLKARAEGKPLVAIASIYQRSPVVLISLADSNITKPQDLIGKTVSTQSATTVGIAYEAMLAAEGIDQSQLTEVERTDFTLAPLFNGDVDVLPGFVTNDGIQAEMAEEDVNFILVADYGIEIYGNVIFTTEETILAKPELVESFVKATVQGMQWVIDNPDAAAQNVLDTYGEGMSPEVAAVQEAGMQASLPLLSPAGSKPGMMTDAAWEGAHEILVTQGIIEDSVDVSTAYTLTFLDRAYAE